MKLHRKNWLHKLIFYSRSTNRLYLPSKSDVRIDCCQVTGSHSTLICTTIKMITIQIQWVANRHRQPGWLWTAGWLWTIFQHLCIVSVQRCFLLWSSVGNLYDMITSSWNSWYRDNREMLKNCPKPPHCPQSHLLTVQKLSMIQ